MAAPSIPMHVMREAVDAVARCGGNVDAASRELKIVRETFRGRLRAAQKAGIKPSPGLTDYNDAADLKRQVKLLMVELGAAKNMALTDTAIKRQIIKLAHEAAT